MNGESRFSLNLLPRLAAGERILHSQPWLWAASGKSLPSYRVSVSVPLVQEMGLCVTDRRVVLCAWVLRLFRFEWVAWFERQDQFADQDSIKEISVGRSRLFGRYLQLVTHDPVKHWWRSCETRVRLYMKNPESLSQSLNETLRMATPGSEQIAAPNGGPAAPVDNSEATEGPPSVS